MTVLSNNSINHAIKQGKIIILPFDNNNLKTSSYDVTLGNYFYRETGDPNIRNIYNIYHKDDISRIWKEYHTSDIINTNHKFHNFKIGDRYIMIHPGETILAHTNEFIGTSPGSNMTTMMKARSTMGRNFIEVCKCAGWGDVGYFNRWTLEITNNSRFHSIPLKVGERIAQIVFMHTDEVDGSYTGKYQNSNTLQEIIDEWKPESMLPKAYKDLDI